MDLVCDLRAELFTICQSWLHDLDSAILSELTLPGYSKLCHCPRADRRGGGTALLYWDGLSVNKVFSTERSSFEVSEWLLVFGSVCLCVVISVKVNILCGALRDYECFLSQILILS